MKFSNLLFALLLFLNLGCKSQSANQNAKNETEIENTIQNVAQTTKEQALKSDFSMDYLMGKFDPNEHPDFVTVDSKYADETGYRLRKETYLAFLEMHKAALQDGIDLKILSATRPFYRQKQIWEAKWNGTRKVDGQDLSKTIKHPTQRALKILTYSSMPGTSRHHWGTEIDLNSLEPDFFESGKGKVIYEWLAQNASKFGFCQPYSPKGAQRPHGYNEEKWHWSYLPIAIQLTDLADKELKNELITGFDGSETAVEIDVVQKYVLGVNAACKH